GPASFPGLPCCRPVWSAWGTAPERSPAAGRPGRSARSARASGTSLFASMPVVYPPTVRAATPPRQLSLPHIPSVRQPRPVPGQPAAVDRELHRRAALLAQFDLELLLARGQVPQRDRLPVAARQRSAVRRERQTVPAHLGELEEFLAGGEVDQPHRLLAQRRQ